MSKPSLRSLLALALTFVGCLLMEAALRLGVES